MKYGIMICGEHIEAVSRCLGEHYKIRATVDYSFLFVDGVTIEDLLVLRLLLPRTNLSSWLQNK